MCKLLTLTLFAITVFVADVSGTWNAQVETDAGSGSPTFVLKQAGEEITGRYSGALGEADVKGTIKGDKIEFRFTVSPQGDAIEVVYAGILDGDKKMKGTVKLGSLGSGTFTAERK
jgi:hypothetical protein